MIKKNIIMENKILACQKDLKAYAYRLSENTIDAEDLVQDTYVRALSRANFEIIRNVKSYLMSMMHNIYIDNTRRKKLNLQHKKHLENTVFAHKEPTIENTEIYINLQDIYKQIDQIKDEWREPFLLFYQGYEYEEMTKKTGVKINLLRSRVFYARRELAKKLQKVA
jgi:RNA polymerase sigma factor (sigma-70 family)